MSLVYLVFYYYAIIIPNKFAKNNYESATCTILQKQLTIKHKGISLYKGNVLVNYVAEGVNYSKWIPIHGLNNSYFADYQDVTKNLEKFAISKQYECWYNPEVPTLVTLDLQVNIILLGQNFL
jgi:ABC-type microcin C transport system permease subunit YejB